MANGKDLAEVIKFLSLLARLKDCCDDDPKCLSDWPAPGLVDTRLS